MNFGQALEALKQGKKIARKIWGGYWYMEDYRGSKLIFAELKDGGYAPAQAYQSDILAEDWEVKE